MLRLSQFASVAQSVVHLTRNEKVACSSQVTSSKKHPPPTGDGCFFMRWADSNGLNATRASVAGEGLTEPNLIFCLWQKCKRVRSLAAEEKANDNY